MTVSEMERGRQSRAHSLTARGRSLYGRTTSPVTWPGGEILSESLSGKYARRALVDPGFARVTTRLLEYEVGAGHWLAPERNHQRVGSRGRAVALLFQVAIEVRLLRGWPVKALDRVLGLARTSRFPEENQGIVAIGGSQGPAQHDLHLLRA